MLKYSLFFIFLHINLFANNSSELDDTYYVKNHAIYLSDIVGNTQSDYELYKIEENRHSIRIKTKDLLKILKIYGYQNYTSKHQYINFMIKSTMDISKIKLTIQNYYKENYSEIEIKDIEVTPMSYSTILPQEYEINIQNNSYLSNKGVLNIKTPDNKKIFLNYNITAELFVYFSSATIKKDEEIVATNSSKKNIALEKFRDKPIQSIEINSYQAKHQIAKNMILTIKDVETLVVAKRNSSVDASINNGDLTITFSAKALQDGKIDDIIDVQKNDGTKLKAKVIGKDKVEIK